MSQQVQFIHLSSNEYNALLNRGAIQQNRLYFISDLHRLYKGTSLYAVGAINSSDIADFDYAVGGIVQNALSDIDEIECESLDANGIKVNGKDVSVDGHPHNVNDIQGIQEYVQNSIDREIWDIMSSHQF